MQRVACSAFYSERADTSCEGRAAVGGSVLQLLLRSLLACHRPIHASIRPPTPLSVTGRSLTSLAKPFTEDLVQVLASTWNTAHVHKQVKYKAAYIVCVSQCVCVFRGYGVFHFTHKPCLYGSFTGMQVEASPWYISCLYVFIVNI